MKSITIFSLLSLLFLAGSAQNKQHQYLPEFHGTIRTKYEYQTSMGAGRFEVRNARLSCSGQVIPAVGYKAEIDLSDEGEIKMKDAYVRICPVNGWAITAGQMRIPFTIDAHRSPHLQYFANRSFIAKQVANVRDVGLCLRYQAHPSFPLVLEAGIFNGSGVKKQKEWRENINYSMKAQLFPLPYWNLTLCHHIIKPAAVSMYCWDMGTYYEHDGFHVEAECLYKRYANHAYHDVYALNSFANYDIKQSGGMFHKISLLVRYDWMTSQSDAITTDEDTAILITTDNSRHRITGGVTLSLSQAFQAEIRLNYEKYFYPSHAIAKSSEQDKIVMELMIRF